MLTIIRLEREEGKCWYPPEFNALSKAKVGKNPDPEQWCLDKVWIYHWHPTEQFHNPSPMAKEHWDELAKIYLRLADYKTIFPKLPSMLKAYYNHWKISQ